MLVWLQGFILAGVVQRTMYRLRADVETKLNRLPLGYIDRQARGDLLSRVTNDIDNVSQSLQQSLSQLLTSTLTIIGVTIMMITISPLLSLVALVTIPISLFTIKRIAKRAQPRFIAQWRHTGVLNAQVEEAFNGHAIVKAFGRQHEVEDRFATTNEQLYEASFGAQFASGVIQPAMMFIGNLNFVAIAVIGGLRVSAGALTIGDIQAFIQYSRQFTQPLTQVASMANVLQSGIASARAGLRAARRGRADARRRPRCDRARTTRAGSSSTTCRSPTTRTESSSRICHSSRSRAARWPSSGRPARGRRRSST